MQKYKLDQIFKKDSKITQKVLRGYVERHNLIKYQCKICGCNGIWQNGVIQLELHHIDGDNTNNELSNLEYLCPNCHALTENYRGKNKKSTSNISEEDFIQALKSSSNIRQALLKLGLAPAGSNYTRAKDLLNKYQIIQK